VRAGFCYAAPMDFDRMVGELFREEAEARKMATRLVELGEGEAEGAVAEQPSLIAFLRGAMEKHMHYEEAAIFPRLERRGFGEEVTVATKHHGAVRESADALEATSAPAEVAKLVARIGKLLLQHTNFEQDYLYPELTHEEWAELLEETTH
jgi:iron-sulfur cluster repair protein YtfE (RIC family)